MQTVESLIGELEMLLESGLKDAGEGIVARSDSLVASRLLGSPVSGLDHAYQAYWAPLSRVHALDYLAERLAASPSAPTSTAPFPSLSTRPAWSRSSTRSSGKGCRKTRSA